MFSMGYVYRVLDDYPADEFTRVYWIKFKLIMAARKAKRKLDNRSFFGGILHVSYAPEFESAEETREKLMDRKRIVERKLNYAKKQSKSEQESHHEPHSLQFDSSNTTTSCSRASTTEAPDRHSMASSSSTHTMDVYHDEPVKHVDVIANESTYTPLPPRLPPLTLPTYPSQVPTMSTSFNTPQTSANFTCEVPARTEPPKLRDPYVAAQPPPVTTFSRTSYGYNSDVSLPARPQNQETGVSSRQISDDLDNVHTRESLTGDLSLDRTVRSIREKLNKVNKRSITETQVVISEKKKKQRKRI